MQAQAGAQGVVAAAEAASLAEGRLVAGLALLLLLPRCLPQLRRTRMRRLQRMRRRRGVRSQG